MAVDDVLAVSLVFGSLLAAVSTVPYTLTAIDYRRRDNGLAYLLLVLGVGIWNLMFVAQLLSPEPLVKGFFLGLAVVGAVLTGLGWFLFATTASSTSNVLDRRGIYAIVAVLGGLSIVFAMTSPVHTFYWQIGTVASGPVLFATVVPGLGYWLHTGFIVLLFAAGAALFATSRRRRDRYPRAYTVGGVATLLAVAGSNAMFPGGFGIASITAMSLTTTGWLQAARGNPLAWLR